MEEPHHAIRKRLKYTVQDAKDAVAAIRRGMPINEACSRFQIPKTTLHNKLKASQEENIGSPPPLLWCGQSTSESGHDGSFFGAENLVECELRAPSPHEAPAESTLNPVKTLLRAPIENFIGRDVEHEQLLNLVASRTPGQLFSTAITGPPGVGKTELLIQVVTSLRDFHNVLWMRGDSLQNSLERSASLLGTETTAHAVFSACAPNPTLLLYDNVVCPEKVQDYLPPVDVDTSNFVMLVTSQYTEWDCDFHMPLTPLENFQGVELLTSQLGVAADIAEEISQRLNNLPLALQMVIAYKKRETERAAEKTETETDPYAFLHFKLAETERDGYNKSLYEVLDQSIQVVAQSDLGPQAVKVLNMIAFMEPSTSRLDNAVLKYMRIDGGMIAMNKIITMLQKYSLIQESGDDLVMFRLYKAILRAKCDDPDDIVKQVKQILR